MRARICAAALLALAGAGAQAQTAWPAHMASMAPSLSESPVAAALPADVMVAPPPDSLPPDVARWSGLWHGWACPVQLCDIKLAVEQLTAEGAVVVYARASAAQVPVADRVAAHFAAGELVAPLPGGMKLVLRMRPEGDIEMSLWRADSRLQATGVLTQKPIPYTRSVERVPTPWSDNGRPQTLEMVVYRPQGPGPFPTLVFNHGSTGDGNRPEWFVNTSTSPGVGNYFARKGWQVVFPQRRGRGKSDGLYDEGFLADRSRYACEPAMSLPGLDRALEDLDVVMAHLLQRPDVDGRRLLIGGVSRGGILSVAYAGRRPRAFQGVLNFVGGWVGDRCPHAPEINGGSFRRGAAFGRPVLWLYGARDPFYSLGHSRSNFDAFIAAGGKGSFVSYEPPPGQSGHSIHSHPPLWQPAVEAYLQAVATP